MKPIGILLLILGSFLFAGGIVDSFRLRWLECPEATDRLLFMEHTLRVILHSLAAIGGGLLGLFGFYLVTEK